MSNKPEKENFLARWLDKDLSDAEIEAFDKSEEGMAYKDILNAMEYAKKPGFDVVKNLQLQKGFNETYLEKKRKVIPLSIWLGSIAAAAILLIGLKFFLFNYTVINTGVGETKTIQLPDNSIVKLNAVSKLKYISSSFLKKRTLSLEGQAFFKVAKGQKFTVEMKGKGKVQVLGTQFDVISRNSHMKVRCYEGKVQVEKNLQSEILTKGKGVFIEGNKRLNKFLVSHSLPSWVEGQSSFKEELLQEVISELQRQYEITIEIGNINLERHFTGVFPNSNLKLALQAVFESMNIDYTFVNQNKVFLKNR